jgi:hypothetical protein
MAEPLLAELEFEEIRNKPYNKLTAEEKDRLLTLYQIIRLLKNLGNPTSA